MSEVTFRKDKYMFSTRNIKKNLDKNILKKEISTFIKELRKFKVDLKSLSSEEFNLEERNLILNIAYFLKKQDLVMKRL